MNKPAFPRPSSPTGSAQDGMTMREYFATHAPIQIPAWYTQSFPGRPEEPTPPARIREECLTWKVNPTTNLYDQFAVGTEHHTLAQDYQTHFDAWRIHAHDFDAATEEARYFAWRYYFADQMIEWSMK